MSRPDAASCSATMRRRAEAKVSFVAAARQGGAAWWPVKTATQAATSNADLVTRQDNPIVRGLPRRTTDFLESAARCRIYAAAKHLVVRPGCQRYWGKWSGGEME